MQLFHITGKLLLRNVRKSCLPDFVYICMYFYSKKDYNNYFNEKEICSINQLFCNFTLYVHGYACVNDFFLYTKANVTYSLTCQGFRVYANGSLMR